MKQFRKWLYHTIFEAETIEGKLFDITLLSLILLSFALVMLESIRLIYALYGSTFYTVEWILTILFTIEYALRLYCVPNKRKFVFSFYGIIDFLSVFPFYLALLFPALHFLGVLRVFRLLRIFRIFNLVHFLEEGNVLMESLWKSRRKIIIFLFFVLLLTVILGSVMYVIENEKNEAFSSIPQSIYWAIVTLTTVGYGDISPITTIGKMFASLIMILGYAIIAVPTGIVTANVINASRAETTRTCPNCLRQGHDSDAVFCKYCAYELRQSPL
ncbi:ion transporter [Runella sp.]|uniref:ion transporter n=1 Tax=Runella sp. TaxID=1960881 RepID=UPI003D140123